MHKIRFISVLRCLCVCLALALCTAEGGAQNRAGLLTRRELRDNAAPTLYDAVAQLRPDWLLLGVGTSARSSAESVLVFVNSKHVGALDALRAIDPREVLAVRVRTPEYVRSTDLRFPREDFGAALFVDLRRPASERPRGRLTVSPEVGINLVSLPKLTRSALHDQGYTRNVRSSSEGFVPYGNDGTRAPLVLGGSLHYQVRGAWGTGLSVQHTMEARASGADPQRYLEAARASLSSAEAALVVTRQVAALRVGVGPVVRSVDWAWADPYCRCEDEETSSSTAFGAAAEVVASLPLSSSRVFPEFKLLSRYYPSQESEYSKFSEPLEVGGLVVTMSIGVATRF